MWNQCAAKARDVSATGSLSSGQVAAFANGNSVMTPPTPGTFGTMGRNIFRDSGFRDWDLSVFKNFTWKERYNAQFRLEMFNILNHPVFANPYGASGGFSGGNNDPSSAGWLRRRDRNSRHCGRKPRRRIGRFSHPPGRSEANVLIQSGETNFTTSRGAERRSPRFVFSRTGFSLSDFDFVSSRKQAGLTLSPCIRPAHQNRTMPPGRDIHM